jgi:ubiquinone/menaquinone biosynthesis C-methylase UbiE
MHPAVFKTFDQLCRARNIGGSVLEVGATPDESTLLNLPALNAAREKIGINQAGPAQFRDFSILNMNANDMASFPKERFDVVLCNATLEHDPFFWLSLAEIRRVTKRGGWIAIGTPGYTQLPFEKKLRRWLALIPRPLRPKNWALQHSTLTLVVHNYPGDYYRFSEQAYREVFFQGMKEISVQNILSPPRIIGSGIRP